ncbi:hypothetical protein L204_104286 [Cryptococcus depauperatus]|nr:DNA clamp loader [Cryptococcus depauperatus CBS 7855]
MAGPAKRTRNEDENSTASFTTPLNTFSTLPPSRQTVEPDTMGTTPPATRANSASRRPAVRLTLSTTLSSARRTDLLPPTPFSGLSSTSQNSSCVESQADGGRLYPVTRAASNGTLLRTQSAPAMASPISVKDAVIGGSEAAPKGSDGLGLGDSRRYGKGKENIPPKKDEEQPFEPARKRMRVTSRGNYSGQGRRRRSVSVTSVRSETAGSGRHTSLAPSISSMSIGWSGGLASPSLSQASLGAPSNDATSHIDRLPVCDKATEEANESIEHRPITRSLALLPTPPPSTPSNEEDNLAEYTCADSSPSNSAETESAPSNAYRQLKAHLRLSTTFDDAPVDEQVVGRQAEKLALRRYLNTEISEDVGMYVSGPPGTGKTALVNALGRELVKDGWTVVELGCMGIKPSEIWKKIALALQCGKTEKEVREFIGLQENRVLIVLDEIDSLMPPPPAIAPAPTSHLLAKLFSLPLTCSTTKLVAISNTLDLTVRARLVLPQGRQPDVLPFKAYNQEEMSAIINARVNAANAEPVKVDFTAIALLGKKVEAQSGDLRMCLDVLGSAVSLAEAEWTKKISQAANDPEPKPVTMTKVSVSHVMKAFTSRASRLRAAAGSSASGNSITSKKIKSVQLQGKMVFVALLVYIARVRVGLNGCPSIASGSSTPTSLTSISNNVPASTLYTTYFHLLSHSTSPIAPAAEHDYQDLLSNLETLGLIAVTLSVGRGSNVTNVSLCIDEMEIMEGLGLVEGQNTGVAEEEVKRIWDRESAKVRRVKKKLAQASQKITEVSA